jgi:hypothetical protein
LNLGNDMLNIFYNMKFTSEGSALRGILSGIKSDLVDGEVSSHDIVKNNLIKGLDRLGCKYSYNNYLKGVLGSDVNSVLGSAELLYSLDLRGDVVLGPAFFSHPRARPNLLERHENISTIVVPSEWVKDMFEEWWGKKVGIKVWPAGIDTDQWREIVSKNRSKKVDFLIYDKIHFKDSERYLEMEEFEKGGFTKNVLEKIKSELSDHGYGYEVIKYGNYDRGEFLKKLNSVKAAIFLSTNETQGMAYQEMLSTNTPVLAWNRGGVWKSPGHYPKVKYEGVSSIPYWSEECGVHFKRISEFSEALEEFSGKYKAGHFRPRHFIEQNLSIKKSTKRYIRIVKKSK